MKAPDSKNPEAGKLSGLSETKRTGNESTQDHSIIRFPVLRRWPGPRQRIVEEYLSIRIPHGDYRIPLPEDYREARHA